MLKKIAHKIGIDGAISYTVLARVFQSVGGIVTVLLIAMFLSEEEQGFYYTFGSLLAIQLFFELGLGGIIVQFVAHEKAHITEQNNNLIGEPKHISRLSHLLHFCIKWYSIISIILSLALIISGLVFFGFFYKSDTNVSWVIPWILISIGTALNFILVPISSFVEGLGKVKEIAKIRLVQQILSQATIWTLLIFDLKLYAAAISPFVLSIVLMVFLYVKFGKYLLNIYRVKISDKMSYLKEIFPLQWRTALSWVSGYFIFQLFNPIIFATEGAVMAGQMGMTLSIANTILGLCYAWNSTKLPTFSMMVARHEYNQLDELFKRTFLQSIFAFVVISTVFFSTYLLILNHDITIFGENIAKRFLTPIPMLFMLLSFLMLHIIGAYALYLRSHKKEPMVIHSIVFGVISACCLAVFGELYGINAITISYFIVASLATIWAYIIFKTKKETWHANTKNTNNSNTDIQ